jgi:hypothetical protein
MPAVAARLLIVIFVLGLPAVAAGQESPKLDPNSPAGVEYQLPLDRAREEAAGETQRDSGGAKRAPAFGAGVTERRSSTKDDGSDEGSGEADGGEAEFGKAHFAEADFGEAPANTGAKTASATSGGGAGASVPLIAAAVLLVGGALGLGLRRGLGGTPGQ